MRITLNNIIIPPVRGTFVLCNFLDVSGLSYKFKTWAIFSLKIYKKIFKINMIKNVTMKFISLYKQESLLF